MKSKFFGLAILTGLLMGFLWARSNTAWLTRPRLPQLVVESDPSGLAVLLDNTPMGVTPWIKQRLPVGFYRVQLKNDDLAWSTPVEIDEATSAKIVFRYTPEGRFYSAYLIKNHSRPGWHMQATSLTLVAAQDHVTAYLDGNELGLLPLVHQIKDTGEHTLSFSRPGFASQLIPVNISRGDQLTIQVDLSPLPWQGLILADQDWELIKAGSTDLDLSKLDFTSRAQLGLPATNYERLDWEKAEWQTLRLAKLYLKDDGDFDAPAYLNQLYYYFQSQYQLEDLPFAYAVDEDGQVYELLSAQDFNFQKLHLETLDLVDKSRLYQPGVCPIVYLTQDPNLALTSDAQHALKLLVGFLAQPSQVRLQAVTELGSLILKPGERRQINVELINLSSRSLEAGDEFIFHTNRLSGNSLLFDPYTWLSEFEVLKVTPRQIKSGQSFTLSFWIRAPLELGEHEERFSLKGIETGQTVLGSQFTLKFNLADPEASWVSIQDTPTGYLNVRSAPQTTAAVVGTVYVGEQYLLLSEGQGWYKIQLDFDQEGYIYSKYAKKS